MTEALQQIMSSATAEQKSVIENASASAVIISCPGSGKTFTTALRMAQRLKNWQSRCSGIALLSHTNIAINSFEEQFRELGYIALPKLPHFVGTLDGFITQFLLSNFGHIVMKCSRQPSLVNGNEKFLSNQQQLNVQFAKGVSGQFPINIGELMIGLNTNGTPYIYSSQGKGMALPKIPVDALKSLNAMGKQGFYTHDHARYWGAKVLDEMPKVCAAIARRFPEIIVDEAQDTNPWQQHILCKLEEAGAKLMLVGDPDQAIFEFGLGNATHLKQHKAQQGVDEKKLSKNLRSNQAIVTATKNFGTATDMSSDKICNADWQGAYIIGYDVGEEHLITAKFQQSAIQAGLSLEECVVIARSRDVVNRLRGDHTNFDNTITHRFAQAALQRDYYKNPREAFETCKQLILSLCEATQQWREIERNNDTAELRKEFRKKLWNYVRDSQNGLPCASLKAKTEWQPKLKGSLATICQDLVSLVEGFTYPQTLGNKITIKNLNDNPVISSAATGTKHSVQVNTVHGVKGDTFDAALYVMKKIFLPAFIIS